MLTAILMIEHRDPMLISMLFFGAREKRPTDAHQN